MPISVSAIEIPVESPMAPNTKFAKVTFLASGGWEDFTIPIYVPSSYCEGGMGTNQIYDDARIVSVARSNLRSILLDHLKSIDGWKAPSSDLQMDFVPPGWSQPKD